VGEVKIDVGYIIGLLLKGFAKQTSFEPGVEGRFVLSSLVLELSYNVNGLLLSACGCLLSFPGVLQLESNSACNVVLSTHLVQASSLGHETVP